MSKKYTRLKKSKGNGIWDHFTDNNNNRAQCKYCDVTISKSGGSFGNLRRHLHRKHPNIRPGSTKKPKPDLGDDLSPLDFLVQNEPITALSVEGEVRIKEEPGDWNPADYDMVNVGSTDTGEIKPGDNETKCSSMEEDDHWYYLRSLLPFFRQLDDLQTLRVRTKFQQILMSELSNKDPTALTLFNVSSSNMGQHT